MTQAQKLADLSQAFTAGALGFRNLLHNTLFRVNQRRYASGTGWPAGSMMLDRWRNVGAGQATSYVATANGYTLTVPAAGIEQVVEGIEIVGGKYCLSWTGTSTATINGNPVTNGGNVTLPSNTNVSVRFFGGTLYQPQLEIGVIPTIYQPLPPMLDMAICQRFLPGFEAVSASAAIVGTGYVAGANSVVIACPFKTRARAQPLSIEVRDGAGNLTANIFNILTSGASNTSNGCSYNSNTNIDIGCILPTTAATLTPGQAAMLSLNSAGATLLFAGAEL